ncbi:ATP-binding cassette domain-containing protein [Halanaerobium sp. ST460_2HS_T2]|uniref:ATP-binding cassette domain-containing protein n=1 Tax=Halanaerobium sp. ST460_2HS_T2 TaxID=2183914 RepID=UPI000DF2AC81|nr:ATP-binding cassette domain-containing protein [Halanaerobium sp. ST460_2HS_T2]RCW55414.1 monosaccharide ABC transporter ATP-binding protein (CUT2 family) [Halanaerobium sp. ST460_2HS_T2]
MSLLVEMKNIHKNYGRLKALRGIDFNVGDNEIVGVLGDNGAGKSTLIKIITGLHPFNEGEMYIKGEKIDSHNYSVKKAHQLGIETVYQEQALAKKQELWRNIFLGRQLTNFLGFINVKKEKEETQKIMRELMGFTGIGANPEANIKTLSGGEKQGVAIGRAMYFDADLVILDEPTMALSLQEVRKVLNFIRSIKEQGKSCVYISHNISNVYPVSDRFVAIDRGKVVGEYIKDEISLDQLNEELVSVTKVK